jgi:type II secretory pathway predicted ATPase ExeA
MYKDFFGLQRLPFNLTPDPSFLFLPPKHREALAGLTYAILERKGFAVLTGEAGTGKTTLINSVLSRLPSDRLESSMMLNPTLSASEFLESVLLDFDIPDIPASKAQRLWKLQHFLARAQQDKRLALLIIDEAHKLHPELLEEIRLLGNFENASEKFLQILLVGQPELDGLLNRADLRQFKQRIALRLHVDRFSPTEVEEYIQLRWSKAGSPKPVPFTDEAVAGVNQWSQGIPRLINSLCDTALLIAYGDECPLVGLKYVRAAAINLTLAEPSPTTFEPQPAAIPTNGAAHVKEANGTPALHRPTEILPVESRGLSTLAAYQDTSSSFLKRLAEKLGIG